MRIDWEDLPDTVRHAVQTQTGTVLTARSVPAGRNSAVAAVLRTATGEVFVKGLRLDDRRRIVPHQREAAVNPFVLEVSPRLLWHVQSGEWDLLGFEPITGRTADYTPGSGDLPQVATALRRLAQTPAPNTPALPLRGIEQRWAELAPPNALQALAGATLCHTDLHPDNIMVEVGGSGDGATSQARIIDWAWPTKGAAWIDSACLALWLIARGHTPDQAETWAAQIPAWHTASAMALDIFTAASTRLWEEIADADGQSWKRELAVAAQTWAAYRSR